MKKNETFIGTCEEYTYEGAGVVHNGGMVFFVPGLIAGEEAELAVTALKRTYGYARIVKLLKPSEKRRQPACSAYRLCGGCQLLHMDYTEQKQFKEDKLRGCFRMNAHMEIDPLPILSADVLTAYRNKVQVPVQFNHGKVEMGFYQNRTNRIIDYENCLVQTDLSNSITLALKKWIAEAGCAQQIRHILIKHAHRTGQVMVCLIARHARFKGCGILVQKLTEKWPQIRSIITVENRREDNVILDGKETVLYGNPYIEEELLGKTFRISARSFFQINPYATELLYSTAIDWAQPGSDTVLIDLYCGTGTIGILAADRVKKVYGIEIVEEAIADAKINAGVNGVNNIEFMAADANEGARKLLERNIRPDIVIVDPPRKGCSKETLNAILKMSPDRMVYVSCDPATLARDCAYMRENGYEIKRIRPVDMFPGTIHVETVCCLYHQKNDFISVPYEPKDADYLKQLK